ncbi:MAG: bifunctional (p)ppGpp synthetase/guanosine-3',5'-bis(diphosphate) 3'-pyrophosphohydrolase, partial [Firmicutes bacterium]|nr:bifunctional (p)ppGpp synthetase/guanosine-3',5'-bis(diphosphate) 3'-pyrophosphohydrolase [Bacillota bacterium]
MDLFSSQVFVFTPRGEVIDLPAGSTPLDFAFKIHTDVGCKCVGAKVNGKMVTIDHALQNGDIVEIVTSSNSSGPSVDWLKIAKSSTARTKIRQFLRKANKSDDVAKGRDALDKYVRKKGYDPQDVERAVYLNKALKETGIASGMDELYVQIANSSTLLAKYAGCLFRYHDEEELLARKKEEEKERALMSDDAKRLKIEKERREDPGVFVKGADNLMIRIARCCGPVPGDEIVGFITKGRGITVHRKDCSNVTSLPEAEKARFIEVEWEDLKVGKSYNADICIIANDRKHVFSDISKACDDMDVHIAGVNSKVDGEGVLHMTLTLSLTSTQQMQKMLRMLRNVEGVESVYRARS